MATKFGDWLNARMAERDWSQADLARHAHVTRQVIYNYVNKPRPNPDKDNLSNIAKALNLSETEVFRAAGQLKQIPDRDEARKEILDYKLAELSDDELDRVIEYIEFLQHRKQDVRINREGVTPPEVFKTKART